LQSICVLEELIDFESMKHKLSLKKCVVIE